MSETQTKTQAGPEDFPLQFVELNGAKLAYKLRGSLENPIILTLHGGRGFGTHKSEFKAYGPMTDEYCLISFDYRGHGQSSFTPPFTFAQIVDDIEAMRQHFAGDRQVIICGGSFGGFLAQQYAITYPDKLSHLILRGTAPSHEHEAGAFVTLSQRLDRAPMATPEMLHKVFGAFKSDEEMRLVMFALDPLYTEGPHNPNRALENCNNAIYRAESHNELYSEKEKYFDYRPRLHEVLCPTFIVAGEKDWVCPVDQSELMHKLIPRSKLLIVKGANHSVHHEQNELVTGELRKFLKNSGV